LNLDDVDDNEVKIKIEKIKMGSLNSTEVE